MAQNITLLGASYADVPSVLLPKTGGGTAQFIDTTDADAAASDIASGKTAYVNGTKLTGTASSALIETGTFTISTTTRQVIINHGLGIVPKVVFFRHQDIDTAPSDTVRVSALGAYLGETIYVSSSAYKTNGVYDAYVQQESNDRLTRINVSSSSYGFVTWNSSKVECVCGNTSTKWKQGKYDYIIVG